MPKIENNSVAGVQTGIQTKDMDDDMGMPCPASDENQADFMARCVDQMLNCDDDLTRAEAADHCAVKWNYREQENEPMSQASVRHKSSNALSADEAHAARADHLRVGSDGRELMLKVASAPSTWNAGQRSARFVMTSQTTDRYGDIVVTDGVNMAEFMKNPVAFLNHKSASWPIGQWANVEKQLRGRPPRLEGDLVLHEASGPVPEIDQAAWMVERGYLKACSIGFLPDWDAAEKVLDAAGEWRGGIQFNQSELLECSLCGIPANPQALVKGLFSDRNLALESIEMVLDGWARGADGLLLERNAFESTYRIVKRDGDSAAVETYLGELDEAIALSVCEKFLAAKGRAVMTQDRIEAIERAARNKRLADKRARELDAIKTRASI